jgi:hypothetical protein
VLTPFYNLFRLLTISQILLRNSNYITTMISNIINNDDNVSLFGNVVVRGGAISNDYRIVYNNLSFIIVGSLYNNTVSCACTLYT